ncbi:MAG TPA: iron-containing alcohol dehydrogenase [Rectinemataceae bacterium]|nr:iron-containing alcohol dehydrogenase [Rectinemataceae bacterium]
MGRYRSRRANAAATLAALLVCGSDSLKGSGAYEEIRGKLEAAGITHVDLGGGSEMDSAAEVDDDRKGHGSLYGIYPDFAIYCSRFSCTLSVRDTAYGSPTTFIQIASRYFSEGASPVADAASEELTRSIIKDTLAALAAPRDEAAKSDLMLASALGAAVSVESRNRANGRFTRLRMLSR